MTAAAFYGITADNTAAWDAIADHATEQPTRAGTGILIMPTVKSEISVNTRPVADRYANEKIIEFSSPVGGGLISFTVTPDDQLSVHVYRQDLSVQVTAGSNDQPVQHGNTRADQALYEAAKAFIANWESRHAQEQES